MGLFASCWSCALRRRAWMGAALGLTLGGARADAPGLLVLVPQDVLDDWQLFLRGRAPQTVHHYSGPHARRDVAEVLLLHHALAAGGGRVWTIKLEGMPSDVRLQRELVGGHGLCGGTSFWRDDLIHGHHQLLTSEPLLRVGEFEAGFYVLEGNTRALAVRDLAGLRQLTVLSNRQWRVDWRTLQALQLPRLVHAGSWSQMPRMLASGRADVVLAPFQPTPDLSWQVEGLRLRPIPGLRLALAGTRHYVVANGHALSATVLQQINAGLAQLRRDGQVQRAYTECGFFNARVQGWPLLAPLA
ncbi:hypothetical protein ACG0Z6_06915 [Roseateles sp. BYS180W]|uniref:Solute-binding protein family 3/N-terminal domain-containing protein n=1 Tax=Roseateles rivi TaxID=3299028 RepID=A0ABW7FUK1_9BURK